MQKVKIRSNSKNNIAKGTEELDEKVKAEMNLPSPIDAAETIAKNTTSTVKVK